MAKKCHSMTESGLGALFLGQKASLEGKKCHSSQKTSLNERAQEDTPPWENFKWCHRIETFFLFHNFWEPPNREVIGLSHNL